MLTAIAARVDGVPCCTYIGPDGAGHFVKMVHNGIEYADIQLIAETYDLLRHGLGLSPDELAAVFRGWNEGRLQSYLIEITSHVLAKHDDGSASSLVDAIEDEAEQKGTGRWTSQSALELGVPLTAITEAVFARVLSSQKGQRVKAADILAGPAEAKAPGALVADIEAALYASKIVAYAQGFEHLAAGSKEYRWNLDLGALATIWRGGCIIRAKFLDRIKEAYEQSPDLPSLMLAPFFQDALAGPAGLAPGGQDRGRPGHPHSRVRVLAGVLRRLPPRARSGEPHPGSARLLRRPHLSPRRPGGRVPHALGAGRDRGPDRLI